MDTRRIVIPEAEEIVDRYFPVLDYGFVALKDYMGGDVTVEESARVSYGRGTRKVSDTRTLLRYLFRSKHSTPFESSEVRLHIGLPIFVMRQLVRHRTANLNEYSGRYSIMPMMFYVPERGDLCYQSKENRQGGSQCVDDIIYNEFHQKSGITRGTAAMQYRVALDNNVARELARIDLPLSTYTFAYWKIDLRNMFNVLALRSDSHAQKQIRVYGDVMAGIVKRLCPLSFEAFQDYQQTAVTFSQSEMRAIRLLSSYHVSPIAWESPPASISEAVAELFVADGATKREIAEFWDKLKVRVKKDYSLDTASSRSGDYYRNLAEKYAVEHPHE